MVVFACLEQTIIGLGSAAPAISDALPPPRESSTLLHAGSPLPGSRSLLHSAESWEGLTIPGLWLGEVGGRQHWPQVDTQEAAN